jgi:nitrite reductase/ring-hydroxylating ferredoxin subunit
MVTDVPMGTGKVVEVGGKKLAIFNADGRFYAMDNTCQHRGGPLGEGSLAGTTVTCPWHGWTYEVSSGACGMNPAMKLQTYDVKVEGQDLLIAV